MPQLVLQPCSLGAPMRRFEETVLQPVLLADHQDLLGADAESLGQASENGYVALWGIVPNTKVATYKRMRTGDRVLFVGSRRGFYTGVVTYTFHNPALAGQLWGHDAEGRTWEYMYSIGQGAPVDVDGEQLNRAIGYESNAAIMGFTVLPESRSTTAFALIDTSLTGGSVRPLKVNPGPRRGAGLAQLTDPEAVVAAMAEYDNLGKEDFLRKYGFGPARSFMLVEQGRDYDSKAIAGAALAYQPGVLQALPASEFSGGAAGAARKLRQLGFRVETRGNARPADQLTREAVQAAIDEFHHLGRDAFLKRYAAHPAERFFVEDRGEQLDAKAIIQAAWRHQHPDQAPLQANDFRGDRASVAEPLRHLGFWVDDLKPEPQRAEPPNLLGQATFVESERSTVSEYETTPSTGTVARRMEGALVSRFEDYLRSQGHVVGRVRIRVPGEMHSLITDPYDTTTATLYEAKSSSDRATVRLAVGQLLDYLRFIPNAKGSLLLPHALSNDLLAFVHACGFGVAYAQGLEWISSPCAQELSA